VYDLPVFFSQPYGSAEGDKDESQSFSFDDLNAFSWGLFSSLYRFILSYRVTRAPSFATLSHVCRPSATFGSSRRSTRPRFLSRGAVVFAAYIRTARTHKPCASHAQTHVRNAATAAAAKARYPRARGGTTAVGIT